MKRRQSTSTLSSLQHGSRMSVMSCRMAASVGSQLNHLLMPALELLRSENSSHSEKQYALRVLRPLVRTHWHEIAGFLLSLEALTDSSFVEHKLAALIAAETYYCMNEYGNAMDYALAAGDLFEQLIIERKSLPGVSDETDFVRCVLNQCVEVYASARQDIFAKNLASSPAAASKQLENSVSKAVEAIVEAMVEHSTNTNSRNHKLAIGVAIDSRRLDLLMRVLLNCSDPNERNKLRRPKKHYTLISKAGHPRRLARTLQYLLHEEDRVDIADAPPETAYQIVFDLFEFASQSFMQILRCSFCSKYVVEVARTVPLIEQCSVTPFFLETIDEQDLVQVEERDDSSTDKKRCLERVLNGNFRCEMLLHSQIVHNVASLTLLKMLKDYTRGSLSQSALIITNGLMHAATTCDKFLRDNLEWLSHASNWAKFSASATLGLIHRFHELESLHLMEAYLPRNENSSPGDSPFAEGGGLYAIGLIYAGHENGPIKIPPQATTNAAASNTNNISEYLIRCLTEATEPPVKHGAALGIGLTALCSRSTSAMQALKTTLSTTEDAIVGEASSIAYGMVMCGDGGGDEIDLNTADFLLKRGVRTSHEKVSRGIGISVALLALGKRNAVWPLIDMLTNNYRASVFLRRAIPMSLAMAFVGTGNCVVIDRLLKIAVNDVDDNVRRSACESLGFVMYGCPTRRILNLVSLLKESYNPHVRFGACMALGIACASTGDPEIISSLHSSMLDSISFVRVAAILALAMVFSDRVDSSVGSTAGSNTASPSTSSKTFGIKQFRVQLMKNTHEKLEDPMVKYASILSFGILDAYGRNAHISIMSEIEGVTRTINYHACVGMLLFSQFWYWFPLTHMIALTYKPNTIVATTANIDEGLPDVLFESTEPVSSFIYVPNFEEKREKRQPQSHDRLDATSILFGPKRRRGAAYVTLGKSSASKQQTPTTTRTTTKKEATKPEATSVAFIHSGQQTTFVSQPSTFVQERSSKVVLKNLTPVRADHISSLKVQSERFKSVRTVYGGMIAGNWVVLIDSKPGTSFNRIQSARGTGDKPAASSATKDQSTGDEPSAPKPFKWSEDNDDDGEKMDVDEPDHVEQAKEQK